MATYIPVDTYVTVNPGVIAAGGNDIAINGLFIGQNPLIPSGQITEFNSAEAVSDWFGSAAYETKLANVYFNGFDNCTKYPSALYFLPYVTDNRAAWARGASLRGMTLEALKAITGTLSVTIGAEVYIAEEVNLSAATSFTDAATTLTSNLNLAEKASVTWDALSSRFTITTTATGAEATISQITGTAAKALGFATAILSQGAVPESLTDAMNYAKVNNMNWAMFATVEQLENEENTELAIWVNNQKKGYGFVMSDNDPNAELANNEACFGFQAMDAKWDGVVCVYDANENPTLKAFILGTCASINWDALNGRIDLAYKSQSGLTVTCRDGQTAQNLINNGYSYYGAVAGRGRNNTDAFFYNGNMPGSYSRLAMFVNQIWLNNQLKWAVLKMMRAMNSIPYNSEGYTLIRAACLDPINAAINNGVIRNGVLLSEAQKAQIVAAIGFDISNELYSQGWYLQITEATAAIRARRASPVINFYYCDGGSIEQITIASFVVE